MDYAEYLKSIGTEADAITVMVKSKADRMVKYSEIRREHIVTQAILKQECVAYKGGKCQFCGYSKCLRALEFHHVSRHSKRASIAELIRRSAGVSGRELIAELNKCVLLCANCHREVESGLAEVPVDLQQWHTKEGVITPEDERFEKILSLWDERHGVKDRLYLTDLRATLRNA